MTMRCFAGTPAPVSLRETILFRARKKSESNFRSSERGFVIRDAVFSNLTSHDVTIHGSWLPYHGSRRSLRSTSKWSLWQTSRPMASRISSASASPLLLVCLVTLASAFNLPSRSPDFSSQLALLRTAAKPAQQRSMLTTRWMSHWSNPKWAPRCLKSAAAN